MSQVESNWGVLTGRAKAERRQSARKVMQVLARVRVEDLLLETQTVDLSSHGVSVSLPRPLNVGQECVVELGVSVPEIANSPVLRAAVRYCSRMREGEYRIGMQFTWVSIEAAELIVAVLG